MARRTPQEKYFQLKRSFDPDCDITPDDFYFVLRSCKADCLLKGVHCGGNVTFHGKIPEHDEQLTPALESDIVMDWLEAIGGVELLEHVFRVFSKDLEKETLADLRPRISDCLETLQHDINQTMDGLADRKQYPPNAMMIVGGTLDVLDDEKGHLQTVECFDFDKRQWTNLGNIPETRLRCGAGVVGGKVYLVGGMKNFGWMNSVDEYDPFMDTWTYNMPTMMHVRYKPGVAVLNDHIYAVGGLSDNDVNTVLNTAEVLNMKVRDLQKWKNIANMPVRRFDMGVGVVQGKLYVVGGEDNNKEYLSSVVSYDPELDVWSSVADLSGPRVGAAVGVLNDVLYCVGGSNRDGVLKSVEKYDPRTNTWTSVGEMNHGRRGAGVVSYGGLLYAVGGVDSDSCHFTMEAYDAETDSWTTLAAPMNQKRCDMAVALIHKPSTR